MQKTFFILSSILLVNFSNLKAQAGKVCNWDGDKKAAVVLTFDDWSPGQYPIVVPELKEREMAATFFPMLSSIASWNHPWPDVIETVSYGNEIGNHTKSHPDLTKQTAGQLSTEIKGAKKTIDENLTTQSVISFDYPYGAYNDAIIDSVKNCGHIAARGVNSPTNYTYNFAVTDKDYYELRTFGMDNTTTTKAFFQQISKVINGEGLLIYMYHSVDDANGTYSDNWYAKVVQDSLQKQLDTLLSVKNKVWITTLGQAIKYHREARCSTINEVSAWDGEKLVIELTDTLSDNALFNQPLTIKLKMNGKHYTKAVQNNRELTIDSIKNDTIVFRAIPDDGNIILTNKRK